MPPRRLPRTAARTAKPARFPIILGPQQTWRPAIRERKAGLAKPGKAGVKAQKAPSAEEALQAVLEALRNLLSDRSGLTICRKAAVAVARDVLGGIYALPALLTVTAPGPPRRAGVPGRATAIQTLWTIPTIRPGVGAIRTGRGQLYSAGAPAEWEASL